jgi:hypothetical protein
VRPVEDGKSLDVGRDVAPLRISPRNVPSKYAERSGLPIEHHRYVTGNQAGRAKTYKRRKRILLDQIVENRYALLAEILRDVH